MDNKMRPLADRMRPTELSEIVGQKHILGEGKILNRIAKSKNMDIVYEVMFKFSK